jgi:hypothetical protein
VTTDSEKINNLLRISGGTGTKSGYEHWNKYSILQCADDVVSQQASRSFRDSHVWWHVPIIPALMRPRQEDHEFEANMRYMLRTCLKRKNEWKGGRKEGRGRKSQGGLRIAYFLACPTPQVQSQAPKNKKIF